jgi:apolipoprotein N-acyltransferase
MAIVEFLLGILQAWGSLFAAPLKDFNMLWVIIPIYLNWIFTEFYQEKRGTSIGNAISNGFVAMWVGIDWMKIVVGQVFSWFAFAKGALAVAVLAYGFIIIFEGVRAKRAVKFIGRIREVTYVCLMLTPLFYGVVAFSFTSILAIIIGFPVFYGIVELIDRIIPTPKTYAEEEREKEGELKRLPEFEDIPEMKNFKI